MAIHGLSQQLQLTGVRGHLLRQCISLFRPQHCSMAHGCFLALHQGIQGQRRDFAGPPPVISKLLKSARGKTELPGRTSLGRPLHQDADPFHGNTRRISQTAGRTGSYRSDCDRNEQHQSQRERQPHQLRPATPPPPRLRPRPLRQCPAHGELTPRALGVSQALLTQHPQLLGSAQHRRQLFSQAGIARQTTLDRLADGQTVKAFIQNGTDIQFTVHSHPRAYPKPVTPDVVTTSRHPRFCQARQPPQRCSFPRQTCPESPGADLR